MTDFPFAPLQPGRYGAILMDPPWWFRSFANKGSDRSAENHYSTMTLGQIAALPVAELAAKDCALFLWATYPMLQEALLMMQTWGFAYKTGGPWVKLTAGGEPAFGTGYIFRNAAEQFLVGTIGSPSWGSRSVRNLIMAPRREHSRKPGEMRAMIEEMLPDVPKCELFAREGWPGQDVWGDQAQKFGGAA